MEQKRQRKKTFPTLVILILLFPFSSGAVTSNDFIRGYAAAVLEREFQIKDYSMEVSDQTVKVTSGELKNVDAEKVIGSLSSVEGVKKVELLDSQGVMISSSTAPSQQAPAASVTSRDKSPQPEYELGFLPGGNLFDPLIADPRWPHFSVAYKYYLRDPELKNVAAVSFGESIALYRN